MLAGFFSRDIPHQGRFGNESAGQFAEFHVGITVDHADRTAVTAEDQAAVGAEERAGKGVDLVARGLFDVDGSIEVALHQFFGADQVEFVILFKHARLLWIGE